jgi:hypothetical protein
LPVNECLLLVGWVELCDEVLEVCNGLRPWAQVLLVLIALERVVYATLCDKIKSMHGTVLQ